MTVVAFLQNMWFKDPEGARELLAKYESHKEDGREAFIGDMLFFGCLTGRRPRQAFGEPLCEQIVWEEVSREIGGHASSRFPADPQHIRAVLQKHQPRIVLAFGAIACAGLIGVDVPLLLRAPHPAARGPDTVPALRRVAEELKALLTRE